VRESLADHSVRILRGQSGQVNESRGVWRSLGEPLVDDWRKIAPVFANFDHG
jgi:hypothetical protein